MSGVMTASGGVPAVAAAAPLIADHEYREALAVVLIVMTPSGVRSLKPNRGPKMLQTKTFCWYNAVY
jgi:hypothetical protein